MKYATRKGEQGFTLIETMVALAVLLIVLGTALYTTSQLMLFSKAADRTMLVATENQRGMREMKNDLYCSSRNCVGQYAPIVAGDELRFRVVTGFDDEEGRSTFCGYFVCFWLDSDLNLLVRRFRDATENLLEDPPAEFPGAPTQVISQYCTGVSYSINADAGMVTITLTNSIGEQGDKDYANYSKQFSVIPFNCD